MDSAWREPQVGWMEGGVRIIVAGEEAKCHGERFLHRQSQNCRSPVAQTAGQVRTYEHSGRATPSWATRAVRLSPGGGASPPVRRSASESATRGGLAPRRKPLVSCI